MSRLAAGRGSCCDLVLMILCPGNLLRAAHVGLRRTSCLFMADAFCLSLSEGNSHMACRAQGRRPPERMGVPGQLLVTC